MHLTSVSIPAASLLRFKPTFRRAPAPELRALRRCLSTAACFRAISLTLISKKSSTTNCSGKPLSNLRRPLRSDISVEHHHQANHERQEDAVLQSKSEQPAFVFPLHPCRCSRDGNTCQADHLTHHS